VRTTVRAFDSPARLSLSNYAGVPSVVYRESEQSEAANRPPTPAFNIASVRTRYYGIAGTPPWGPKEPGHAGKAASPQ